MAISKALDHDDTSGFQFVKRALGDNPTAAINFDRLQKHPDKGYIIFEFLKCEESQYVSPYTSHPNRYRDKNASKFLALWRAKLDFCATLYLVNYAEEGTTHADEVLVMKVLAMDESGITNEEKTKYTFRDFSDWFIALNKQCLQAKTDIIADIYSAMTASELGEIKFVSGQYKGRSIADIYTCDHQYLEWYSTTTYRIAQAVRIFLKKKGAQE